MGVLWEDEAWQEYIEWQAQDKKTLRKINQLVKDIQRDPFNGMGHPEPLSLLLIILSISSILVFVKIQQKSSMKLVFQKQNNEEKRKIIVEIG